MASDQTSEAFEAQVQRVRDSGWLGRSYSLSRLFDYLAESAREDRPVREADLAQDVFDRASELSGDASVRVYIHRLRKKLQDYYAGPGLAEVDRLSIPIGDYRLVLETPDAVVALPVKAGRRFNPAVLAACLLALLVVVNLGAWWAFGRGGAPEREAAAIGRTALWSGISGERPVVVVVGDYYIFGEAAGDTGVARMVRDFDINSEMELESFIAEHPEYMGRYIDLDTTYTPTGATLALHNVLPVVLQAAGPHRVQVITASQLVPSMLRDSDIVYVGYLSGMRILEDAVFSDSRLQIGMTYDELQDRKSGRSYTSSAGAARSDESNLDFAYLRTLRGPSGNRVIVIAGMRDIGVVQAAEIASDLSIQSKIKMPADQMLEQLYEVTGIGRTNLNARLVDLDKAAS